MKQPTIADIDIPLADPNELIIAFTPLVCKVANRYKPFLAQEGYCGFDDLVQAGRIGLLTAQKRYVPSDMKFQNFAWNFINAEIKKAIGYTDCLTKAPVLPVYADQPLTAETEDTILDFIPDESNETSDEIIDRMDRAEAVHEAVDKLCDSQKEIIDLHFFQNKEIPEIAQITGMDNRKVSTTQHTAILKLQNDKKLMHRIMNGRDPYSVHVGVGQYNTTWTSATELGVIIRERREHRMKKSIQEQIDALKKAMEQKNQ